MSTTSKKKLQTLTQAELAETFGVTDRTILNLTTAGKLPKPTKEGNRLLFPLKEAVAAYIAHREAVASAATKPKDFEEAKARKMSAEAELAELDLAEKRGALVQVSVVAKKVEEDYSRVRARMLSMPSKLAPQMVSVKSIPQAKALIEAAVHEALAELGGDGDGDTA